MSDKTKATLEYNGEKLELDVVTGTQNEVGIDIGKLRQSTGLITLDPGFVNTGSCSSSITYIDGANGKLCHRGYTIEDLCENSTFVEVAYLLIYGNLPSSDELMEFRNKIGYHALLHEDMKNFFQSYSKEAHPMAVLSSMVCTLSVYHPKLLDKEPSPEELDETIARLLSKVRAIAACAYRRSIGRAFVDPILKYDYIENFMYMMFSSPLKEFKPDPVIKKALNLLFILHADHEQNCSASTVRMVGSSKANLFASVSAGICALWGPLHGGANQAVIEMLEDIAKDGADYKKYINKAKDKSDPFRLMGFGHRVYKNYDPRAKIIKNTCDEVLEVMGINDPILEVAKGLEEAALNDSYFVERKLFPNVDFYSGIIYKAIGIPTDMFTVMFALGRLPGWIAQWKEMIEDPKMRISRPRQIYTGKTDLKYPK